MGILMVFFLILTLLGICYLGLGWYVSRAVINKPGSSEEQTLSHGLEEGEITPAFMDMPREEFTVPSPWGYSLRTLHIHPPEAGRSAVGTVIFIHGITSTWHGMVKYMGDFLERGWQVYAYNQRNHYGSGGRNKTYGFFEKGDLKAVLDAVELRNRQRGLAPQLPLVLYGESMGAATMLQYNPQDPRIRLRVNDCSFSDMTEVVAFGMNQVGIPKGIQPFLVSAGSLVTWLRQGFFFRQVSPREAVKTMTSPVLTLHGEDDETSPVRMARELQEAIQISPAGSESRMVTFTGAGHARSILEHSDRYRRELWQWIESHID